MRRADRRRHQAFPRQWTSWFVAQTAKHCQIAGPFTDIPLHLAQFAQQMLSQPVSARTRLRTGAAFLKRPEQAALASTLGVPARAVLKKSTAAAASKPPPSRRAAPHEVALSGAALLGGTPSSMCVPPREARAEERKKRAAAKAPKVGNSSSMADYYAAGERAKYYAAHPALRG